MTMTFKDLMFKAGAVDVASIPWCTSVHIPKHIVPFEHQLSGINLLCTHDRAGIYDQTGTGKTLSIQAYALYIAGHGNRVVVLMPPVLISQFKEAAYDTFINIGKYVKIEAYIGTAAQRKKLVARYTLEGYPDILLMTYHMFRGSGKTEGMDKALKAQGYNVLIADEAQALRNSSSSIHKKVYRFVGGKKEDSGYGLVLSTGTPSHTHLEQNYGLIRLVTPRAYGTKAEYERLHVIRNHASPFNEIIGYDNYDVMTMNLYARARRVEKADVADIPPKVHTVVPVDLHPKHLKLYKRLLDERILELKDEFIDATQDQTLRQTALRLISSPNEFSDVLIPNHMNDTIVQLVNSIDIERTKVIIFIHFNLTATAMMELFEKFNPALLNGSVTKKDVQVKKFLHDESCRILVAHPLSAGAGLNLQSVCSDIIFMEAPDSPGDFGQSADRVHRISGTKSTVNIYLLSAVGTWAVKKIKQLMTKDSIINRVVGDKKAMLSDLFDDT